MRSLSMLLWELRFTKIYWSSYLLLQRIIYVYIYIYIIRFSFKPQNPLTRHLRIKLCLLQGSVTNSSIFLSQSFNIDNMASSGTTTAVTGGSGITSTPANNIGNASPTGACRRVCFFFLPSSPPFPSLPSRPPKAQGLEPLSIIYQRTNSFIFFKRAAFPRRRRSLLRTHEPKTQFHRCHRASPTSEFPRTSLQAGVFGKDLERVSCSSSSFPEQCFRAFRMGRLIDGWMDGWMLTAFLGQLYQRSFIMIGSHTMHWKVGKNFVGWKEIGVKCFFLMTYG